VLFKCCRLPEEPLSSEDIAELKIVSWSEPQIQLGTRSGDVSSAPTYQEFGIFIAKLGPGLQKPIIIGLKHLTGDLIFPPSTVIMHASNPYQTIGPNTNISGLPLSTANPLAPLNISKRVIISLPRQSEGPKSRSLQSPLEYLTHKS
jgi:hypothetical protein